MHRATGVDEGVLFKVVRVGHSDNLPAIVDSIGIRVQATLRSERRQDRDVIERSGQQQPIGSVPDCQGHHGQRDGPRRDWKLPPEVTAHRRRRKTMRGRTRQS